MVNNDSDEIIDTETNTIGSQLINNNFFEYSELKKSLNSFWLQDFTLIQITLQLITTARVIGKIDKEDKKYSIFLITIRSKKLDCVSISFPKC